MTASVAVHYGFDKRVVKTTDDLDALLDEIIATGRPTWAEIVSPDETLVLNVGLGRAFSSLTFYDLNTPAKYGSSATLPDPDEDEFDYGGTPTPMQSDSAITVEEARQAAREFVTAGQRPTCVDWQPATA